MALPAETREPAEQTLALFPQLALLVALGTCFRPQSDVPALPICLETQRPSFGDSRSGGRIECTLLLASAGSNFRRQESNGVRALSCRLLPHLTLRT